MPFQRTLQLVCLGAVWLGLTGCQRNLAPETTPPEILEHWVDAPLTAGAKSLGSAHGVPAQSRVYRLDRLLDLFDAARFSGEQDRREELWIGLGGGSSQRGPAATRGALVWMLDEALSLEDAPGLGEDEQVFLASAINLLTSDLYRPGDADDLSAQTTAYRTLVREGHPRVADNAQWRLYDHIRGSLAGAASAAPARRSEIATHALYTQQDSIEALLDDLRAVHVRPAMPGASELGKLLEASLAPLVADPRWQSIAAARVAADRELVQTLASMLPASREPLFQMAKMPAGTGVAESNGPIVRVTPGEVVVDLGRPQQVVGTPKSPAIAQALVTAVAQDGRGTVLLAVDEAVPAPELTAVLGHLAAANTARVEFAVSEPRIPESDGVVITAIPLDLEPKRAHQAVGKPSRLHIHLSGRGPQFRLGDQWLAIPPPYTTDLFAFVQKLRKAYHREAMVTLSLSEDVAIQQLRGLLLALVGGPQRVFTRVVWLPVTQIEVPPVVDTAGKRPGPTQQMLTQRLELAEREVLVSIEQSRALQPGDQQRVELRAKSLFACIPELRGQLPKKFSIEVALSFAEGVRQGLAVTGTKPASQPAFEQCLAEQLVGLALHQTTEPVEIKVQLQQPSAKPAATK